MDDWDVDGVLDDLLDRNLDAVKEALKEKIEAKVLDAIGADGLRQLSIEIVGNRHDNLKATIHGPEDLVQKVDEYLAANPDHE